MNLPIEKLDISIRCFNLLNQSGIADLNEVAKLTKEELVKFRNFGSKSIQELEEIMKEHNLNFKQKTN